MTEKTQPAHRIQIVQHLKQASLLPIVCKLGQKKTPGGIQERAFAKNLCLYNGVLPCNKMQKWRTPKSPVWSQNDSLVGFLCLYKAELVHGEKSAVDVVMLHLPPQKKSTATTPQGNLEGYHTFSRAKEAGEMKDNR
jgi:hypothetical protein